MANNPLKITDTILRDAHQSQAATRMKLEDMLPACEILDSIGYWSLECWGGATFDSCMRFLNEDPWERLRALRKAMPNTKLQMLFRGQNILGYKHYADDVVEQFVKKSIENGIDVIRIFDALNDPRNLKQAIDSCNKYGGWVEAAISYTVSPVHNEDYFVRLAMELEKMGAKSICIKDMANLLLPYDAYSLVKKLKENVEVPIHLHTHNTAGTGDMTNLMAAQAGVDIVDCALSPMANGTANPSTEAMVATMQGTDRDTGLDLNRLSEAAAHFRTVASKLKEQGILDPKVLNVDPNALLYQVPGGMLSNMISQLKQANAMDKYYDVLAEVPRVRKDFGYPPLVTPTSQIVGTQAVMNILAGERYKMVSKESKGLLRGEYGKLPADVNEEVRRKCLGDQELITCRPADLIDPEYEKYKAELGSRAEKEEDVLSYALFPQVADKFFKVRDGEAEAPAAAPAKAAAKADEVRVLYVQDSGK
ncbi:MAG: oxaloacetate decarboxylase subunit alpha [Lachnospiraceae bacterium]|nr:oxaloacetate decarboxylase subunit alpha [Lachnospiraceae bacterium]